MASVQLKGVDKVYPEGTHAVVDLDLTVEDGEFMVLVGPSGCGKTTVMRMIAGLEPITGGEITIGDQVINNLEPRKRDIAMVFQNYALYPQMTVAENMAFGLKMRKMPKRERLAKVAEIGKVLGMTELLDRKPSQLSGGQRQRVAMGRAIVRNPSVFLMDEPLSNLDAKLRVQMRAEIARIQRELQTTTIYVTHDQVEAMTMGTRVAVMRKGVLQQVGEPRTLYERPTNLFVASFMGSPSMNLFRAEIRREDDQITAVVGANSIRLAPEAVAAHGGLESYIGRATALGIRAEHVHEAASGAAASGGLRGVVQNTELLGSELLAYLQVDAQAVATEEVREVAADVDLATLQQLDTDAQAAATTIIGRFEPDSRAAPGETIEVKLDTRHVHLFDLETEQRIGEAR